jgi:hypothetical protein
MNRQRCFVLAVIAASLVGSTTSSHAATLVSDMWSDGTRTDPASPVYSEMGVDSDSDGNLESAWFGNNVTSGVPSLTVPSAGTLRGAVATSSVSWTTYFTPEGSEVNLANNGDSLRITWDFTPTGVNSSNTSQNFRIALVDSPSSARLTTDNAPGSAAYAGYALFLNVGQTTGRSTPFQLLERTAANSDLLSTSANWGNAVNAAGFGNGAVGYVDGQAYELVMTLTRNGSSLDIAATMTGGNINSTGNVSVSTTDASPNSFVFDTFSLRPSNASTTASQFDTSRFKVEFTTVPEIGSLWLMGLGVAASLAYWRRR